MLRPRLLSVVCLALACVTATEVPPVASPPASPPPRTAAPTRTSPPPTAGWEPVIPYRAAELTPPTEATAAALRAAGEAALAAGVVDVAAHWFAEAHAREPSPELAQRIAEARADVGLDAKPGPLQPLTPEVARPLRAAIEAHDWPGALTIAGAALAEAPHPELFFWAGDAHWQQGREVEARRMWSRARVLARAAGVAIKLQSDDSTVVSDVAWSRGGLALTRGTFAVRWLEVWDDRSLRPWSRRKVTAGGVHSGVAWVAGGAGVALAGFREIHVLEPASGAQLAVTAASNKLTGLVAAETAPVLASTQSDGEVALWAWDPSSPKDKALRKIRQVAGAEPVMALALDPKGEVLALARRGKPLALVDVATGAVQSIELPAGRVVAVKFLEGGDLQVADSDGEVTRIAMFDRAPIARVTLRWAGPEADKPSSIQPMALARNGRVAANSGRTAGLLVCDGLSGECSPLPKSGTVRRTEFSPDGERLVSVESGALHLMDAGARTHVWQQVSRGAGRILGIAPGGTAVAIQEGSLVALSDGRTGAQVLAPGERRLVEFAADGRSVAFHEPRDAALVVHSLVGEPPRRLPHSGWVRAASLSPDGRLLAVVNGGELVVWDVPAEAERLRVPHEPVYATAVSNAGRLLIAGEDGVFVRDAVDGASEKKLLATEYSRHLSLAPDGGWALACDDEDEGARVLDLRTGRPGRRLKGACGARFVGPTTIVFVDEDKLCSVDVQTGRKSAHEGFSAARLLPSSTATVALQTASSRLSGVRVTAVDGRALALVSPMPGFGWVAQSWAGAIDGTEDAMRALDSRVGDALLLAGALAWDGALVRGLLPRAMAGEMVAPPVPR